MSKLPDLSNACKPLLDLFASASEREEKRQAAVANRILEIDIDKIDDFPDHPFQVRDDSDMQQLAASVRENGVLTPATVMRKDDDRYVMVSGHRRKHAARLAGLMTIPCEIAELSPEDAVLRMIESNCQRTKILPSEMAFAYKMRLEALKRKAGRPSGKNSAPMEPNLKGARSNEQLAAESGISTAQIKRYIRLTYLLPPLLEMVDAHQLGFRPAVELSYLRKKEQEWLLEGIRLQKKCPTFGQACRMKQLSAENALQKDAVLSFLSESEQKKDASFRLPKAKFSKYFPEDAKPDEIAETIEKALKLYFEGLHS